MNAKRMDTPTIMDGMVVRYRFEVPYANYPEINASRNCVGVSGPAEMSTRGSLRYFIRTLLKAWAQYEGLQQLHSMLGPRPEPMSEEMAERAADRLLKELVQADKGERG